LSLTKAKFIVERKIEQNGIHLKRNNIFKEKLFCLIRAGLTFSNVPSAHSSIYIKFCFKVK